MLSGVKHGLHLVPTLHSMGWQEYSMDAFVPRLYYCFYCIILHSSHLCWSFWDFQMPVDRFSKIKMVVGFFFWESYIYIYIYIYIGRVCCILFRVNGSKRPHWSSWSGIYSFSKQNSSLTFYFEITHKYYLLNICCLQQVHLYIFCCYQLCLLFPMTSTVDFPHTRLSFTIHSWLLFLNHSWLTSRPGSQTLIHLTKAILFISIQHGKYWSSQHG